MDLPGRQCDSASPPRSELQAPHNSLKKQSVSVSGFLQHTRILLVIQKQFLLLSSEAVTLAEKHSCQQTGDISSVKL